MLRRHSLSWISIFIALVLSSVGAFGEDLVGGKVYVYERGKPVRFPAIGTTKVLFDFDATAVAGPPETEPDQNGAWRGRFDLIEGEMSPLRIYPKWVSTEFPAYVPYPSGRTVRIPGASGKINLRLWEPERLSENLGSKAEDRRKTVEATYNCARKESNEDIARCWRRAPKTELDAAREEAKNAAALYQEAYSHHARKSLLWNLGNLRVRVAAFCDAADAYSRIDLKEGRWTLEVPPSKVRVFESDARIQCAQMAADASEKRRLIDEVITHAQSAVAELTQGSVEKRKRARRILGNWLLAIRMHSDRPNDDLRVAQSIRDDDQKNQQWVVFRDATAALYKGLDFQDPETSDFIVAHRITEISKQLRSQRLPTSPTGIGGDED